MKIPIDKIRPNPNNPRTVISEDEIAILAASMKGGLINAPKGRPLPEGETDGCLCELFSGDKRLRAAKKLNWTELEVNVLDLPPQERMRQAIVDNRGEQLFWLDLYTSIEAYIALDPKMTQKQAAEILVIRQQEASRAIKLLSLLNKPAREAIYRIPVKSGDWQVSEAAIYELTALSKGKDTLQEDLKSIEAAVRVVLDRKMTEKQAAVLVKWVQKGNPPDTFPASGKIEVQKGSKQQRFDPNDPFAKMWEKLPKSFTSIQRKGRGYKATITLDDIKAPVGFYGAAAHLAELENGPNVSNPYLDALPELKRMAINDIRAEEQKKQEGMGAATASGQFGVEFGFPYGTTPTVRTQQIVAIIAEVIKNIYPHIKPHITRKRVIIAAVVIIGFFALRAGYKVAMNFASRPVAAVVLPVVFIPTPTVTQTAGTVFVTQPTATEQIEEKAEVKSKVIVHKFVERKLIKPTPTAGVVLVSQAPALADSAPVTPTTAPTILPAPTVNPDFEKIKSNHFWKLGTQDYEAGDYEGAFGRFIEFREEGYKIPEIFMWIANCKYNEGLCGDALPFYEKYLELRPDDAVIKQRVDDCKKIMK